MQSQWDETRLLRPRSRESFFHLFVISFFIRSRCSVTGRIIGSSCRSSGRNCCSVVIVVVIIIAAVGVVTTVIVEIAVIIAVGLGVIVVVVVAVVVVCHCRRIARTGEGISGSESAVNGLWRVSLFRDMCPHFTDVQIIWLVSLVQEWPDY